MASPLQAIVYAQIFRRQRSLGLKAIQLVEKLLQITLPTLPSLRSAFTFATKIQTKRITPADAATVALLQGQRNKIIQSREVY
ncbi:MAG TPA: hypothetical protein VFP18_09410 [Candidatus Binatia bacterium]|nr:hypothetical protein [Candidatus Binatia bacterium]